MQSGTAQFTRESARLLRKAIDHVAPAFKKQVDMGLRPENDFVTVDLCCGIGRLT